MITVSNIPHGGCLNEPLIGPAIMGPIKPEVCVAMIAFCLISVIPFANRAPILLPEKAFQCLRQSLKYKILINNSTRTIRSSVWCRAILAIICLVYWSFLAYRTVLLAHIIRHHYILHSAGKNADYADVLQECVLIYKMWYRNETLYTK